MANFVFTEATRQFGIGGINWTTDTIRIAGLVANPVAVRDSADTVADVIAAAARYDGTNYADITLSNKAVTEDPANDRTELDNTVDAVWTALGAGTSPMAGFLIFKFVTNDAGSIPIAWVDTGGFPKQGTGSDFTIQFNADGLLTITAP